MAIGAVFLDSWWALGGLSLLVLASVVVVSVAFTITFTCPPEFYYEDAPTLILLYAKALFVSLRRKQGVAEFEETISEVIKDRRTKVTALDCRVDRSALTKYAIVCGYGDEPLTIPPCYLETYFIPVLTLLVTGEDFKLSPLGLIHTRQTITQHTDLHHLLREPFDLEVKVLEYRPTHKGIEVDISLKVFDRREMCVWEGLTTLLSRNESTQRVRSNSPVITKPSSPIQEDVIRRVDTVILRLPKDLGVRYSRASGDWNPHHLWPWSSRLLGYKQPIAHGMWTMARCLTWLDRSGKFPLRPPFHVDVQFKRPVFLPGSSVFTFIKQPDKDTYAFRVHDEQSGAPQLIGVATTRL